MAAKLELRGDRWHVVVNGKSMFNSANKYYAKSKIPQYDSLHVEQQSKAIQFPINERFGFITQFIEMIAKKSVPSMLITGEGGLGKTYTVMEGLKKAGLKDVSEMDIGTTVAGKMCFRIIKGYSTPKGLYRILFENQSNIVVFDDCDAIFRDPDAVNLLKGALDSYDKRIITWNTSLDGDNLPRMFMFRGGVVFISNKKQEEIDQAVRTRTLCIDLEMTVDQKLERMETIMQSESFLPMITMSYKREALELLRVHKNKCADLSLRSLIAVSKIRADNKPNWIRAAEYLLLN